jgi:hypothetical protein
VRGVQSKSDQTDIPNGTLNGAATPVVPAPQGYLQPISYESHRKVGFSPGIDVCEAIDVAIQE